jgi:N-acetylglucosamine malate deacetylase 1
MRVPRPVMRMLARGKPFVPDALWPMLNTVASSLGSGPLVGTPPLRRVLALCAHPDDEAIGCAGTLALLAASGAKIAMVYATRGDATRGSALPADEIGRRREAEARKACEILGLPAPRFLAFADGTLGGQLDGLSEAIGRVVGDFKPDAIFVPWLLDGHSDHRAMSLALTRLDPLPSVEVWAFEWWSALPPNRLVDISEVYEKKAAAVAAHETAHLAFDVAAALALSRWRSLHGLHGKGHAEAFLAAPHAEYRKLVERAFAVHAGEMPSQP